MVLLYIVFIPIYTKDVYNAIIYVNWLENNTKGWRYLNNIYVMIASFASFAAALIRCSEPEIRHAI